jgi:hypothetical protein
VTDERPDPDPGPTPPADDGDPAREGDDLQTDRRAFIRRLSGDAVWTAGRLAGFSTVIRRSVVAAGEAAASELGPPLAEESPTDPAPATIDPIVSRSPAVPSAPAVPVAPTTPVALPDPVLALTAAQHESLATWTQAVLAVNDPSGAPHLTVSTYHWDGALIRLPAQLFTARAEHVDHDPRVSLFIGDDASAASVAVTGVATVAYGDDAEQDMLLLLGKDHPADEAAIRWEEMRSSGDRITFRIRPTRFVWRTG